ncbi:dimethylamine monooxygenase subunit DmmA family protein [Cryobacterium sp. PH31-O1]|uniref:dimethylamine monooxygenase subunit DmmA family protein n=1 Tax=Cryobacterium sp. PH31-O1 TaxID=3046306 RepID=UPI0024BB474A|nr:dimethylamine monooxygenase subunit DmmA family protein [Cryobacterium sp. PH31-O1]MDJ0338395.1 dimethylamine monooxygenase subunit DmmA family protein [Cryobacterium sp. PH31-O1]
MRTASQSPATGTGGEPGFRGVISVSFGAADASADHDADGVSRQDLRFASANPEALANLRSVLAHSRVGVRLVLAGPPADVHAAASAVAVCGLVDEEITILCDEVGPRVIFCGHCHTSTTTDHAIGTDVVCQGCATTLTFTDHFSRRVGGYLGFSAHAEEAA